MLAHSERIEAELLCGCLVRADSRGLLTAGSGYCSPVRESRGWRRVHMGGVLSQPLAGEPEIVPDKSQSLSPARVLCGKVNL